MNSDTAAPYATILLPIIDRAETLAMAIPYALNQSRKDIELLITCSGASAEVLRVAHQYAATDSRISVLDLPPSPERTTTARAEALRRAGSDRIFILQDDDIWGLDHVEVLGAALDHADFASSATLAATLSGEVVCWPGAFNNPSFRDMYEEGGPKLIYEAHYAFRLSCYNRLGVAWEHVHGKGCSRHLLDCFVRGGASVRWASIAEPTALSLNSPPRWLMSTRERAAEMSEWNRRMQSVSGLSGFISRRSHTPIMLWLIRYRPAQEGQTLAAYLHQFGLDVDRQSELSDRLHLQATDAAIAAIRTVFELSLTTSRGIDAVAPLIVSLIEPYQGYEIDYELLDGFLPSFFSLNEIEDALSQTLATAENSAREAYAYIGRGCVRLKAGDVASAKQDLNAARACNELIARTAIVLGARIALAEGRLDDAVACVAPYRQRGIVVPIVTEVESALR